MKDAIRIRGARQHNLKDVDLDIPRDKLVVLTGPSGSGKSTLALDVLFAAGQRRYVEALSTYAKQFLEQLEKPDADAIEGLSPAVAIQQRRPTAGARSTVGTATEIHDYLRLLYARAGRVSCPHCGAEVRPDTVTEATDRLAALPPGTRFAVAFPLARSARSSHGQIAAGLRALGFRRMLVDGDAVDLSDEEAPREGQSEAEAAQARDAGGALPKGPDAGGATPRGHDAGGALPKGPDAGPAFATTPDLAAAETVLVVVDRLAVPDEAPAKAWTERLADSLATCFREGDGQAVAVRAGEPEPFLRFSEDFVCPRHPDTEFLEPSPRLFSFNNPYGSCPACTGFGATLEYDPALVVPNAELTLMEGAVDPWAKPRYRRERKALLRFAEQEGVSPDVPWRALPEDFREAVLYGKGRFRGAMGFLAGRERKRYKQYVRVFLRRYQRPRPCTACRGSRLRPEAGWVTVGGRTIAEASEMPVERLAAWLAELGDEPGDEGSERDGEHRDERSGLGDGGNGLDDERGERSDGPRLRPAEVRIAAPILKELRDRTGFLADVGLGYLTLARLARTLSGGEAQRIALANSLGSRLVDTLYVLDEPSAGLHPADAHALVEQLKRLRGEGNTVLVVEHDEATVRAADHVVELGPGAGDAGGEVVFEGTPRALEQAGTPTGQHLAGTAAGRGSVVHRQPLDGPSIGVEGATLHNLRGVDAEFPVGALSVVTGVSGSGKSTLVHDVLYRRMEQQLGDGTTSAKEHLGDPVGDCRALSGLEHVDAVALVDQSPIGRTPRSNPATYVGAWGEIRRLFARRPEARAAGLTARSFSFNVDGGRCRACKGLGTVEVEMVFMANIHVTCEACRGRRYRPEVLDVRLGGLDVLGVLDLTVERATRVFARERSLGRVLWRLRQTGLGYLRLGQPATTLSGGEAQRLKIAREMIAVRGRRGRTLYILDEPTTGLSGAEVALLVGVLRQLVERGNTLIVVEHDLDVVRAADWVVDMGPGAGPQGGRIVAAGRPEDIEAVPESATGRFLAAAAGAATPAS